jgi:hypothetical protein
MILSYFDENKFSIDRPMFYIGGFMVPDSKLSEVEEILTVIVRNFLASHCLPKKTKYTVKNFGTGKGRSESDPQRNAWV